MSTAFWRTTLTTACSRGLTGLGICDAGVGLTAGDPFNYPNERVVYCMCTHVNLLLWEALKQQPFCVSLSLFDLSGITVNHHLKEKGYNRPVSS